jgi:hypothetical protein
LRTRERPTVRLPGMNVDQLTDLLMNEQIIRPSPQYVSLFGNGYARHPPTYVYPIMCELLVAIEGHSVPLLILLKACLVDITTLKLLTVADVCDTLCRRHQSFRRPQISVPESVNNGVTPRPLVGRDADASSNSYPYPRHLVLQEGARSRGLDSIVTVKY